MGDDIHNLVFGDLVQLSHLSLELSNHLVLLLEIALNLADDVGIGRVLPDGTQFGLHAPGFPLIETILKLTFGVQVDVVHILLESLQLLLCELMHFIFQTN